MAEINKPPSTKKLFESIDAIQNEQKFGNGVFTGYQEVGLNGDDGHWWDDIIILLCTKVGSSSSGGGGAAQAEKVTQYGN
ncbi:MULTISPECIES: hypothetical protein [Heyndrickxia]|jgi:hypothetical protein|uniref:hypothetical protein n=1 Tax=Heyndrickxia TaxID=2837504 RepID=UPI0015D40FC2|nr:hypothetical protein [Heyndrickxia oleronia]MCI1615631.1 hypothetical protein [Heyndrickxia oleronia]MCI1746002.1 hypothetical protein [Heyndrickxia oleronia]MCI1763942.1 hypothetical protein [Heyndrickxia oleronia]NYV68866.1 hypothetical protein [Bacillus sp. Gen3]